MKYARIAAALMGLLLGVAGAAAAGVPPECPATLPSAAEITVDRFVPNAPCLIANTIYLWGQWHLWQSMYIVGMALTFAFVIGKFIQAILAENVGRALTPFLYGAVLAGLLAQGRTDNGVLPWVQVGSVTLLMDTYAASAAIGSRTMNSGPDSVQAKTAKLGEGVALMLARANHAASIRAQMAAIQAGQQSGSLSDPNLVQDLYARQIEKDKSGVAGFFGGSSWLFNAGYLLLYGLFSIFAGIIFAIAFAMLLTLLLLPAVLPFAVLGNFKPLALTGATVLGSVMVMLILPVAMSTIAVIGLSLPADRLMPAVASMNSEVAVKLGNYQTLLDTGCGFADVSCNFNLSVVAPIMGDLTAMKDTLTQLVLALMALLVGLSISANVLRRVPAGIMGAFGAPGGGESTGAETRALGGALKMMGMSQLMGKVMGAGGQMAQKALGGGKGSGKSAPPSTPGGGPPAPGTSGGGTSASHVPPTSATAPSAGEAGAGASGFAGGGGSASSGSVPPEAVTGKHTAVGEAFAVYGQARGGGASRAASVGAVASVAAKGAGAAVRSGATEAGVRARTQVANSAWGGPENAAKAAAVYHDIKGGVQAAGARAEARRVAAPGPAPSGPRNADTSEFPRSGQAVRPTPALTPAPAPGQPGSPAPAAPKTALGKAPAPAPALRPIVATGGPDRLTPRPIPAAPGNEAARMTQQMGSGPSPVTRPESELAPARRNLAAAGQGVPGTGIGGQPITPPVPARAAGPVPAPAAKPTPAPKPSPAPARVPEAQRLQSQVESGPRPFDKPFDGLQPPSRNLNAANRAVPGTVVTATSTTRPSALAAAAIPVTPTPVTPTPVTPITLPQTPHASPRRRTAPTPAPAPAAKK
ncbi:hypothetical protein DESA109040_11370 [Deinococcus saxicola]|uniref:hypothetical protein n=1 Tax=Deinococcus saxicola TaxID=249406 RepID=UPI0039F0E932